MSQKSKIALVCDWLTTPGGAEKVLLELHKMYPDAPIYTSQYNPQQLNWFDDAVVKTGWMQVFPSSLRKILGPLRQLYFSHLDLAEYDLVISVTGAEAKAIKARKHLCYCHVPTQYYWQMYDKYVENPGFGILNPLVRLCFKLLVKPLRKADYRSAQKPDQFVTISTYAQTQIKQYYDRDAVIVAPPVEIDKFKPRKVSSKVVAVAETKQRDKKTSPKVALESFPQETLELSTFSPQSKGDFSTKEPELSTRECSFSTTNSELSTDNEQFSTSFPPKIHSKQEKKQQQDPFPKYAYLKNQPDSMPEIICPQPPAYYIISCRQVTWKRVDLAIQACLEAKVPLLVVGDGSEHARLLEIAGDSPLIKFLPWIPTEELAIYLQNAKAYIFPSLEPFGIAAVEALAAGCPVIAYQDGGSRDFIQPGKNGLLFQAQSVDSLVQVLKKFEKLKLDRQAIMKTAKGFSAAVFRRGIKEQVAQLMTSKDV